MKLLHIDSSIQGENSVSRELSATMVAHLKSASPGLEVTYRNLAQEPLPHLSGSYVAAIYGKGEPDAALKQDLALGAAIVDEFLAADVVVIGAPQYNFSVPSQLKAWIDRITVPGKTFRYTEKGPEGLLGGKRIIVTLSRGGFYGPESPVASLEHTETYLRSFFRFLGVEVEVILAEGLRVSPEQREAAITAARKRIAEMKAA
jgi:FMN-dependent NADH-azoreductase